MSSQNIASPISDLSANPPANAAEVETHLAEIDLSDSTAIIHFGSNAQKGLQAITQGILADVRNKDAGPAGDALAEMVTTLRGFAFTQSDGRAKPTLVERLLGKLTPFAKMMARFETVRGQINTITDVLVGHERTLSQDLGKLDTLYRETLKYYQGLQVFIDAGAAKIDQVDDHDIPSLQARLESAGEADRLVLAQELRDLRSARDDLERRVHDLKLTRQVTMQSLPSIRLVQENDKALIAKIESVLSNTIPLWETQIAQAMTIQRSRDAALAIRGANDLTNELLTQNAETLNQANRIVREEMERGVFDIVAVQKANDTLIATINESLAIADEGKAKRAAAEHDLVDMEAALRDALSSARAKAG